MFDYIFWNQDTGVFNMAKKQENKETKNTGKYRIKNSYVGTLGIFAAGRVVTLSADVAEKLAKDIEKVED
jgi:hypothetical protein